MVRRNQSKPGLIALAAVFIAATAPAQEEYHEILTYLEPYRSLEISSVESGAIGKIMVDEGDQVSKGDALLELDNEVIEARLAVAQAQADSTGRIQAAEAEVTLAQDRLDLLKKIRGSAANEAEIKRQEATLQVAEGNYLTAAEEQKIAGLQVKQIEAELERRILRSPIDGTVAEITKDVAEPVTSAQVRDDTFLVQVVQLDQLKAEGHLPYTETKDLKKSDKLPVRVEDVETRVVEGELEFVSPIIDPATGTVRVRLVINNSEGNLRSGASAVILLPKD